MLDLASQWLITQIAESRMANSVWFSDENILPHLPALAGGHCQPLIISNRWDVAQQANQAGFVAQFSDFDCSAIEDNSQDVVFYRISKEKAVVHYLINQASRILKPGGELVICGLKNEGIKTFIEKAGALFNFTQAARKDGSNYHAHLQKNHEHHLTILLDDNDYTRLRVIADRHPPPSLSLTICSKPGLFGWNKIDQGSKLIVTELRKLLPALSPAPERMLDLGCGYGYLSLMTADLPLKQRVLTDNNAAALVAARANCTANSIAAEIIAADAGSELEPGFDLILCNPPFHQGFSIDGDLTDKFLTSAKRLLLNGGVALFVVNQFIPLERKAEVLFNNVELVAQEQGFKVVRLEG